ncbi:hypothetical protein [Citrobacter koseri]|uniref:hypothetical protein n=1 Tax=Citrobacter koseri TaxID=545 RepID=UPI001861A530|nr:hypothetical protein [Citrobacter koseri]BCL48900.1 hypothetical protein MPUCK001_27180 [Citrobacter koseri]
MTDKQALRQLATDAHELGIIKRYSKGLEAQRKFYAAATPLVIRALLDELEALQSFRTAYMEWSDKTDWVQTDKRLDVIKPWGKHRADVLKLYIDHLKSNLEAAEHTAAVDHEAACSLVEENEELKRKLEAAEQRNAELVHNHRVHAARLIDERGQLKQRIAELEAKLAKPVLLPKTNGYWTEQEKAYEEAITLAKRQVRLAGFRCEGDE